MIKRLLSHLSSLPTRISHGQHLLALLALIVGAHLVAGELRIPVMRSPFDAAQLLHHVGHLFSEVPFLVYCAVLIVAVIWFARQVSKRRRRSIGVPGSFWALTNTAGVVASTSLFLLSLPVALIAVEAMMIELFSGALDLRTGTFHLLRFVAIAVAVMTSIWIISCHHRHYGVQDEGDAPRRKGLVLFVSAADTPQAQIGDKFTSTDRKKWLVELIDRPNGTVDVSENQVGGPYKIENTLLHLWRAVHWQRVDQWPLRVYLILSQNVVTADSRSRFSAKPEILRAIAEITAQYRTHLSLAPNAIEIKVYCHNAADASPACQRLEDATGLLEAWRPKATPWVVPVEARIGIDFENVEDVRAALERVCAYALQQHGLHTKDLTIDLTGGQKITSATALVHTFDRDLAAQYVQTNPPYGVRGYDVNSVPGGDL